MNPINPKDALLEASTELYMALTNGALVVGQTVDAIDREHVEKASIIVKMLLKAQGAQAQ
jgi:hypothetical protein